MSSARVAVLCVLSALVLSACGSTAKPVAGSIPPTATSAGHAKIDDPRTKHVICLQQHDIPVTEVGRTQLRIEQPPSGPTVQFEPTPGAAQAAQFTGKAPGAEVIGSALLFPNGSSDKLLQTVEDCMTLGVKG